jgi:hypothetical protein
MAAAQTDAASLGVSVPWVALPDAETPALILTPCSVHHLYSRLLALSARLPDTTGPRLDRIWSRRMAALIPTAEASETDGG